MALTAFDIPITLLPFGSRWDGRPARPSTVGVSRPFDTINAAIKFSPSRRCFCSFDLLSGNPHDVDSQASHVRGGLSTRRDGRVTIL